MRQQLNYKTYSKFINKNNDLKKRYYFTAIFDSIPCGYVRKMDSFRVLYTKYGKMAAVNPGILARNISPFCQDIRHCLAKPLYKSRYIAKPGTLIRTHISACGYDPEHGYNVH